MIVWRISNHLDLDGGGGLRTSARWHTRGTRVVYCAPNPATALIEVLVHTEIEVEDIPETFRYLEIDVPDSCPNETIEPKVLGSNWQTNLDITQQLGDDWLCSGRTALLLVPSVVVPATWNLLLNPLHPASAQIRVAHVHEHRIDPRLWR